jgi:hypothetical protein
VFGDYRAQRNILHRGTGTYLEKYVRDRTVCIFAILGELPVYADPHLCHTASTPCPTHGIKERKDLLLPL